jgi:hypothetical protein
MVQLAAAAARKSHVGCSLLLARHQHVACLHGGLARDPATAIDEGTWSGALQCLLQCTATGSTAISR